MKNVFVLTALMLFIMSTFLNIDFVNNIQLGDINIDEITATANAGDSEQVINEVCASTESCPNDEITDMPLNTRESTIYGDRCCFETDLHRGCKKGNP